jgi:hypothetical protein
LPKLVIADKLALGLAAQIVETALGTFPQPAGWRRSIPA